MSEHFVRRSICPACGSNSITLIHSVRFSDKRIWPFLTSYYEGRIPKEKVESSYFNIARCNNCELLFQEYILNKSNMLLLYEKWISAESSLNKKRFAGISLFKQYAFEIEGICRFIKKKPHEINVLEYGMGWGFWLNLAKTFNFNVTGVEISKIRIDFARRGGLRVIEDISREKSGSYDFIYSNQVFEHIPNPKESIQELARILRPKGIIQIQVPNGRGIEEELQSTNWKAKKDAILPLEHINCFNRNSLKILATQAGLSLRPPLYYPSLNGIKPFLKSHLRYIDNLYYSTQVYLSKT